MHTRADRSKMLHILSDKKRRFFYEQHAGKTYKVLWEADNEQNMMLGFTENYIKVKTTYDPALVNEIAEVKLSEIDDDMVFKCQILQWELAL
jgi:threonylcarbamoyladenosine tRNA methylthiotransferase MtaB